jgi:NitT/TauT family transport system substrate-binding protein
LRYIVNIGYTQQAALMAGRVDAVVGFVNNDVVRLQRANFPVATLNPQTVDTAPPLVGASLGVRSELIDTNPAALQEYVNLIKRAIDYIIADPEQALALVSAYIPGLDQRENRQAALDTLLATIPLYGEVTDSGNVYRLGAIDTQTWQRQADFLTQLELAVATPVTEAYTTTFAGSYDG